MNQELELKIEGMHCGSCVRRVNLALTKVDGVVVDQVEIGTAKLHFDPQQTSAQQIAAAIEGIGFELRK